MTQYPCSGMTPSKMGGMDYSHRSRFLFDILDNSLSCLGPLMKNIPITVIGTDIVARYICHRLTKSSIPFQCLNASEHTDFKPGFASGGSLDHWTRLSHQYGQQFAQSFWDFSEFGFRRLCSALSSLEIQYQQAQRVRIATTQHELEEFLHAHSQLHQANRSNYVQLKKNTALHFDGCASLQFSETNFLEALLPSNQIKTGPVQIETHSPLTIHTQSLSWKTEACVITDPTFLKTISPYYNKVIYPSWEQWHHFKINHNLPKGTVFSIMHGHIWGIVINSEEVYVGGGSFFNKTNTKKFNAQITSWVTHQLQNVFPSNIHLLSKHHQLICKVQDERPLLGLWPQQGHILLALGWDHWHNSFGIEAGERIFQWLSSDSTASLEYPFKANRNFIV